MAPFHVRRLRPLALLCGAVAVALQMFAAAPVRADLAGGGDVLSLVGLEADSSEEGGVLQPAPGDSSDLGTFSIVIVPGEGLSANAPALAAFNRAAQQWQAYISDPILVTVNANLANLGPNILGQTSTFELQGDYDDIRDQLVLDASDEPDDAIVGSLPTAAQVSFAVPTGFSTNGNVQGAKANFKAMGFANLDTLFGASDGTITFSSTFNFDFDRSDGITPGSFDFETVAAHEIGHLLGFLSVVDTVDFFLGNNSTSLAIQPTPVDLFRFDKNVADPGNSAEFLSFARSLLPGSAAVFDQIDGSFGGQTEIALATGLTQGDGRQASHWKDKPPAISVIGIMDPTLAPGETSLITANDLRAFDLIGYDIAAIPEIGGVAMLSAATALSAMVVRVRRLRIEGRARFKKS